LGLLLLSSAKGIFASVVAIPLMNLEKTFLLQLKSSEEIATGIEVSLEYFYVKNDKFNNTMLEFIYIFSSLKYFFTINKETT